MIRPPDVKHIFQSKYIPIKVSFQNEENLIPSLDGVNVFGVKNHTFSLHSKMKDLTIPSWIAQYFSYYFEVERRMGGNFEKKMNCAFNVVVIAFRQHKKFHNKNKKVMKNTGKENKLKTLLLFSDSFLMCPLMMKMTIMMTRKMMEMPKLIEMMKHLSSIRWRNLFPLNNKIRLFL